MNALGVAIGVSTLVGVAGALVGRSNGHDESIHHDREHRGGTAFGASAALPAAAALAAGGFAVAARGGGSFAAAGAVGAVLGTGLLTYNAGRISGLGVL